MLTAPGAAAACRASGQTVSIPSLPLASQGKTQPTNTSPLTVMLQGQQRPKACCMHQRKPLFLAKALKSRVSSSVISANPSALQVLLVSTIWNTRHAAVEVCTKEMAPDTRSCADADSFVAVNPSGLEHDHKG
ncbi:hypothetical protein WJX82_002880 [Trebouxia sp. C0006]